MSLTSPSLTWTLKVVNSIQPFYWASVGQYGPFPDPMYVGSTVSTLGYQTAVVVNTQVPLPASEGGTMTPGATFVVGTNCSLVVSVGDEGLIGYTVSIQSSVPKGGVSDPVVTDISTYVLPVPEVSNGSLGVKTDAAVSFQLYSAEAGETRMQWDVDNKPFFNGILTCDPASRVATLVVTVVDYATDPFSPEYLQSVVELGVETGSGSKVHTSSHPVPFQIGVPFTLSTIANQPGYGMQMYWANVRPEIAYVNWDSIYQYDTSWLYDHSWTKGSLIDITWANSQSAANNSGDYAIKFPEPTGATSQFTFEPTVINGRPSVALRMLASESKNFESASANAVYLGITELGAPTPEWYAYSPRWVDAYESPTMGQWTVVPSVANPKGYYLLYRSAESGHTYAVMDGKIFNADADKSAVGGQVYPVNTAQGVELTSEWSLSPPIYLPYGPRDTGYLDSLTVSGDTMGKAISHTGFHPHDATGMTMAVNGTWLLDVGFPAAFSSEFAYVGGCFETVRSPECPAMTNPGDGLGGQGVPWCTVSDTPAGVSYCLAGLENIAAPDSLELTAQAKADVAGFLQTTCGRMFEAAAADSGLRCKGVLGVPQGVCSGFLTENFGAACKLACDMDPSLCDDIKQAVCVQNSAVADCACLDMETSPFVNPFAEGGTSSGATYRQFIDEYLDKNSGTMQAVRTHCWWQPCVMENAALVTTDLLGNCPQDYVDCIVDLSSFSVTDKSSVTINAINQCAMKTGITGAGASGGPDGPAGVIVVSPTSDSSFMASWDAAAGLGSTGATGSSDTPPPSTRPSTKNVVLYTLVGLVVAVVVVLGILFAAKPSLFMRPKASAASTTQSAQGSAAPPTKSAQGSAASTTKSAQGSAASTTKSAQGSAARPTKPK